MNAQRAGRLAGLLLAGCALSAHALPVHGAEPTSKPPAKNAAPDLDFLEYLGTLENDGDNWKDVASADLTDAKSKQPAPKAKAKVKAATDASANTASNDK